MSEQAPVLAFELKKLTSYLLNINHPVGGSKAKFLIAHGFDPSDPKSLADALTQHARAGWPGRVSNWPHGQRNEIRGTLSAPSGTAPLICSVWQMQPGSNLARLVTAYPCR